MLLSVPSILLFMWSFVALRVQRPYVERPFLIPGGLPVAVLLTVVPVAVSVAYAAIIATESAASDDADVSGEARSRSSDGGMPPIFQVASALGVVGVGGLVHLGARLSSGPPEAHAARGTGFDEPGTPLPPLPATAVRSNDCAHHAEELEAFSMHSSAFAERGGRRNTLDDGGESLLRSFDS